MNLFHSLHDEEFIKRSRLTKTTALNLLDKLQIQETRDGRVPPHLQLLITFRWMATGSFQLTIADTFDVSQLVSNCTAKIVRAIASLLQDYVKRPSREHFSNIRNYYFEMSGFPGVLSAVDCTHIPIHSPGGVTAEEFRCDSAYPLLPFLLTPVANPVGQREVRYNISHSKARNTIRAFGVLKMRFRCLTIPLNINLTAILRI
nr:putative nuclease HARBI1 [Penaeus vannamei]